MLDPSKNYVIQTDGSIHELLFWGDCDWEERAVTSIQEIRAKAIDECIRIVEETVWRDADMLAESIRELKGGAE